jgi:hypothetical protein
MRTEVRGNVSYYKETLERPTLTEAGAERSEWNTTKIVADPDEQDQALKVRDKCRSLITSVCAKSEFGLRCQLEREDELIAKVAEARELADDFNATAILNHVTVNISIGRVVADDEETTRNIFTEIGKFMGEMENGLAELDADKVRRVASRARNVGQVLAGDVKVKVDEVITAARAAATEIVKAGEAVAQQIDRETINTLAQARTAFLDIDPDAVTAITVPVFNTVGRSLEIDPDYDPFAPLAAS